MSRIAVIALAILALHIAVRPVLAQGAQEQTTSRVHGRVIEQGSERAIGEVRITLEPGELVAQTDAGGRFAFTAIPFGRYTMRFTRIGYVERTASLTVGRGDPVDLTVRVASEPVTLEPIEVVVRSPALERVGFFDRRSFGPQGAFFTEADIERLKPTQVSDLLRNAPSTIIVDREPGSQMVRFNRQQGFRTGPYGMPGCEPAVFLDGMLIQDNTGEPRIRDINSRVPLAHVAAVEVYVGANTPLEYKRNDCGALVFWTKRGG
jgi:hypothetical protein